MANRIESTPASEEAAPAAAAERSANNGSGGGLKAWLPLIITVFLMPLVAFAMTSYVLLPRLQKGLGITAPADAHAKEGKATDEKTESVTMNKLLVNVAGTLGARYLLVSVSVVGSGPDFKAKMEAHDPQLRDMACGALASKTLADLEKPAARNLIRTELISGFNNILGGASVKEIYLTEFAIQ